MVATEERTETKQILEKANELDIRDNLDPMAIYEPGKYGFMVWCIPEDHPKGWDMESFDDRTYPRRAAFVASIRWRCETGLLTGLEITTYVTPPNHKGNYLVNRPEDINWTKEKVRWLFEQAGVPLPEFTVIPVKR
jgi:hypothetical protein